MPDDEPTVARAVLLLAHVPPPASLKIVVEPTQTCVTPVTAPGNAFTVITAVDLHPVAVKVYAIVGVPADTPTRKPDTEVMVASAVLLLLQVPPPVASVSVIEEPTQTAVGPPIAAGKGFTVTIFVRLQPVDNV